MHHAGLLELLLFFPTLVVVIPVFKYLLMCNPLIHNLSCKFTNKWTIPLGLPDDNAATSVEQAVAWATHAEDDRKCIDNDYFSAHYPLPPPNRVIPTTVDVQFTTILVHLVKTTRNISGTTSVRSRTGARGIYIVELYFWNPCHLMTGHVEVNCGVS
uniref:Uncharacterized protein n=1 Tax=Globisporangium ultimum (strain ATCC 200006 / CBS 805.95 / DAOM BR144) TaxID=431595 RepID=K3WTD4_GLOUD